MKRELDPGGIDVDTRISTNNLMRFFLTLHARPHLEGRTP